MNYDIYGDLALMGDRPENYLKSIVELLALGYKKIYLRTKCLDLHRNMDAKWISPYPQKTWSSCYLSKQNNKLFYGNIKTVFYNPRYGADRLNLVTFLKENFSSWSSESLTVAVVGSGISPYTVYLAELFVNITEYEVNSEAYRYGMINKTLNKTSPTVACRNVPYDNQIYDIIVSIIPAMDPEFHKKYRFRKGLVFYMTQIKDNLKAQIDALADHHDSEVLQVKKVRPYSKLIDTYRIFLLKRPIAEDTSKSFMDWTLD